MHSLKSAGNARFRTKKNTLRRAKARPRECKYSYGRLIIHGLSAKLFQIVFPDLFLLPVKQSSNWWPGLGQRARCCLRLSKMRRGNFLQGRIRKMYTQSTVFRANLVKHVWNDGKWSISRPRDCLEMTKYGTQGERDYSPSIWKELTAHRSDHSGLWLLI